MHEVYSGLSIIIEQFKMAESVSYLYSLLFSGQRCPQTSGSRIAMLSVVFTSSDWLMENNIKSIQRRADRFVRDNYDRTAV